MSIIDKLKVAIIGATGYTGLDLTYILTKHPKVKIVNLCATKNLGKEITLPPISDDSKETLGDVPSRYMTAVLDIGTMEKEPFVPKDPNIAENCDPFKIQSQSIMRYNVIFTQIMEMTIPYNANLRAGLTIECEFPRLDREKRAEKDTEMSGLYIIKELCHQFDSEGSFTKLKLIRDTFGN